ncbi:MAG: hypothetical protein J5736_04170, partial [Bacilli bacterium]|nr:hypothetical protein [Bacilli bacterium]
MKKRLTFLPLLLLSLFSCEPEQSNPGSPHSEEIVPAELVRLENAEQGMLSYPFFNHQSTPGEDEYIYAPSVVWDGVFEGFEEQALGGGIRHGVPVEKGSQVTYEIYRSGGPTSFLFAYLSSEDYEIGKNAFDYFPSFMKQDIEASFEAGEDIIDGKILAGYSLSSVSQKNVQVFRGNTPNAPLVLGDGSRLSFCCLSMDASIRYDLSNGQEKSVPLYYVGAYALKTSEEGYSLPHPSFQKYGRQRLGFEEGSFLTSFAFGCFEENPFLYAKTANSNYPIFPIRKAEGKDVMVGPTIQEWVNASGAKEEVNYLEGDFAPERDLY